MISLNIRDINSPLTQLQLIRLVAKLVWLILWLHRVGAEWNQPIESKFYQLISKWSLPEMGVVVASTDVLV